MEQLKTYQQQGLNAEEIQERLQNEKRLKEIAKQGNQAFVEQYFTRRGKKIPEDVQASLDRGLTPYFERGADGEHILRFGEPSHIGLTTDKRGRPHLVVRIGKRAKVEKPKPEQEKRQSAESSAVSKAKPQKKSQETGSGKPLGPPPLSEAEREQLAEMIAGNMEEALMRQGQPVHKGHLKKVALELLASCRSGQNILLLGQCLQARDPAFREYFYLLEEPQKPKPSVIDSILGFMMDVIVGSKAEAAVPLAVGAYFLGLSILTTIGLRGCQEQSKWQMNRESGESYNPDNALKELLKESGSDSVGEDWQIQEIEASFSQQSRSENSLKKSVVFPEEQEEVSQEAERERTRRIVEGEGPVGFPIEHQGPTILGTPIHGSDWRDLILGTPPAKPLSNKEKVPIHGSDWRDFIYAGPAPVPMPPLYMFNKMRGGDPADSGSVKEPRAWTRTGRIKAAQLPQEGRIRFVPRDDYHPSIPLPRGENGGYIDKFDNEWIKGPSRTSGESFEWDVQLSKQGKKQLGHDSRDGTHLNVSLRGRITHK